MGITPLGKTDIPTCYTCSMTNTPRSIIIHCSDVSYQTINDQFTSINNYHRNVRAFPRSSLGYYVGYHVLITGKQLYRCREDREEGAHCNKVRDGISMNFQSLGVCVGFDGDREMPRSEEITLLRAQLLEWQTRYDIPDSEIYFHRDFDSAKTCPGSLVTRDWILALLHPLPSEKASCDNELRTIIKAKDEKISVLQSMIDFFARFISNK